MLSLVYRIPDIILVRYDPVAAKIMPDLMEVSVVFPLEYMEYIMYVPHVGIYIGNCFLTNWLGRSAHPLLPAIILIYLGIFRALGMWRYHPFKYTLGGYFRCEGVVRGLDCQDEQWWEN